MGLFDYVNFRMACPKCGGAVGPFQTKEQACDLATIEPDGLTQFYGFCDHCGAWLDFSRPRPPSPPPRPAPLTREQVEAMGFVLTVKPRGTR